MSGENSETKNGGKVPFEEAINEAGFGLYSYLYVVLTGGIIVAFAFIVYCSSIIVPTSACELGTTGGQQGALAAAPVVGLLAGAMVWGYLGDTRGRRNMLLVSLVAAALVNCLASLSVHWVMLLILQLLATFLASGQYGLSMTLLSESVPMAKRNLVVLLVASIFLLSQGLMAVIAIPVIPLRFSYYMPALGIYWNSWRTLLLIYSIPSFLAAFALFFMTESPKFVLAKDDEDKALSILRTIHSINHRNSKNEFQVKGLVKVQSENKSSIKEQIAPLFRAPLLKYTIIMTILFMFQQVGALQIWLPTVANQFMQMLDSGATMNQTLCQFLGNRSEVVIDPDAVPCSLNNTAMLIVFIVGAIQSTVNFLISLVVNKTGRRNMVMAVTALCGLSGIILNLIPNTVASATLYIVLLAGIVVLGLYTAIAVAVFPTTLRVMAVSVMLTGSRVAGFASIQILNLLFISNCDAGFYIFASLFASSAIVASFLPDDRKLLAPKTQEDSEKNHN